MITASVFSSSGQNCCIWSSQILLTIVGAARFVISIHHSKSHATFIGFLFDEINLWSKMVLNIYFILIITVLTALANHHIIGHCTDNGVGGKHCHAVREVSIAVGL